MDRQWRSECGKDAKCWAQSGAVLRRRLSAVTGSGMEVSVTPTSPSSRDGDQPACGRRLVLGGGTSLLAFPWLGSQAAAQTPANQPASLEAALSSHFGSLPQDWRYRSQVARLAWGLRDYDLGWWSPTGRTTSHRAAVLAESVEGTPFDLHLVLPAGQPAAPTLPPCRRRTVSSRCTTVRRRRACRAVCRSPCRSGVTGPRAPNCRAASAAR